MSDLFQNPPTPGRHRARRRGPRAGGLTGKRDIRARLRRLTAVPALAVMAVTSAVWAAVVFGPEPWMVWAAGAVGVLLCVVVFVLAGRTVSSTTAMMEGKRRDESVSLNQWMDQCEQLTGEWRRELAKLLEQVNRGEAPEPPASAPEPTPTGDRLADFEQELRRCQSEALQAVAQTADRQQVEVFVHIAQRLHALVNRALSSIDTLESDVEDPDILDGLFGIDHLVTQFRRQVESLAVLGGAVPRRISKSVPLATVLRQAVAEIEQYTRVRVARPQGGVTLPGYAAADVIHLLAELVENAAKFSPPTAQVQLRAEQVPAGLAIEVDDRGLPMSANKRTQANELLASPDEFDPREQLQDGRIGLLVAARIANRHNIRVTLRENLVGGTQALVVLPHPLLGSSQPAAPQQAAPREVQQAAPRPQEPQAAPRQEVPQPTAPIPRQQNRQQEMAPAGAALAAEQAPQAAGARFPSEPSPAAASAGYGARQEPQQSGGPQQQAYQESRQQPVQQQARPAAGPGPGDGSGGVPPLPTRVTGRPPSGGQEPGPPEHGAYSHPAPEEPSAAAEARGGPPPASGKPVLPRRSQVRGKEAQQEPEAPVEEERRPQSVPANPGLMAGYAAGIRRASEDSPPPGPTS